ncbi:alpha-L-fucosidase [Streptomyces sp. NPDC001833]|uniref:alpha-L-fucosidase n=1 Tax=Streptomyces sp. NPDC001833 TaxID=3154658 RepID=UPI00331F8C48
MSPCPRRQVLGIAAGAVAAAALPLAVPAEAHAAGAAADEQAEAGAVPSWAPVPDPVPVPLDSLYDNDGIDTAAARGGDFDGSGYTFPGEELPAGRVEVDGIPFDFPAATAGAGNNVVALGQRIDLPKGRYLSALFLTAGSYGNASGAATVHYADGTTSTGGLSGGDWYSAGGPLSAPYRYQPDGGKDGHSVGIGTSEVWIDPRREAVALTLPVTNPAAAGRTALHVFALSLQPVAQGRALALRDTRSTSSLLDATGAQSVEATVVNAGTVAILAGDAVSVRVDVPGARTVEPARIRRLDPGEQARVRVGIRNRTGTAQDGEAVNCGCDTQVVVTGRKLMHRVSRSRPPTTHSGATRPRTALVQRNAAPLTTAHQVDARVVQPLLGGDQDWDLVHRRTPNGPGRTGPPLSRPGRQRTSRVRSVPSGRIPLRPGHVDVARGDGEAPNHLAGGTGAPTADATPGVPGRKGHVTHFLPCRIAGRCTVHSIVVTFAKEACLLRSYASGASWAGHAPRNPYTLDRLPYTGYTPGKDFVRDYQAPQMLELIHGYDPEIIWCDIGGANDSVHVLAEYFNHAKNRARPVDVTVNDRSGIGFHDYTTPEYTTYADTVVAKWEASRGLDPRSYGYNRETPDDAYMTTEEVVHSLVDIVSKNGNFLLDIGPRADGTIPEIMQTRLRETGAWLAVNGEAIYGTTYWSRMAELGDDLRFTVRPDEAFYIHSLTRPGARLTVEAPVPIRAGDKVTMLGHGRPLTWKVTDGALVVDVPEAARTAGQHAWVFKVDWHA